MTHPALPGAASDSFMVEITGSMILGHKSDPLQEHILFDWQKGDLSLAICRNVGLLTYARLPFSARKKSRQTRPANAAIRLSSPAPKWAVSAPGSWRPRAPPRFAGRLGGRPARFESPETRNWPGVHAISPATAQN